MSSPTPTDADDVIERPLADGSADTLSPLLYAELKALATRAMRKERAGHTLQTTALVHEACLRVLGQRQLDSGNRAQFLGVAARMMRRVLVDHARRRAADKRPAAEGRLSIDSIDIPQADDNLPGLDAALERLATLSPRQARVVELKFFVGLELEEIADVLGVARPTVVRDWRMARAWLQRELIDE